MHSDINSEYFEATSLQAWTLFLVVISDGRASSIETKMGKGLLSEDIRDCADRLHELTKEVVK